MKFNAKNYKKTKTKHYIKTNNVLFFFNGVNRNSSDWVSTEQSLKKMNFNYYKVFNKTAIKTLKESIYRKVETTINGVTFLIKPEVGSKTLFRNNIINDFESLLFILIAVKLNNKFYSVNQLKNVNSLKYSDNKGLLYQFYITNLKNFNSFNISK